MIGTGRIAGRFVSEARTVPDIDIHIVCNPNLESARNFAEDQNILHYTDKASELCNVVDAVYIATPHQTHYGYIKQMLSAGIHVLCEKPMVLSKTEAEEMYALAKEKRCILMEAIKTAYAPGFLKIIELAKNGKIGKIKDVEACFTRLTPTYCRELADAVYGGSFTELASYPLLPVARLLGTECKEITFHSVRGYSGVDTYTKAFLDFGDAMATVKTGLGVKSEGQLLISGTRGYIIAESPWWLTKQCEVRYEDPNRREKYTFDFSGAGLRYEIQAFVEQIYACRKGEKISPESAEESIWMAGVMEQFLAQREIKEKAIVEICSKENTSVRIWGHRGCCMRYPENTIEAFLAAANVKGITGVELDTQLTRDGEIVVIHDETINRTTDGTGKVSDYTLEELKQFKIVSVDGKNTQIPTLREVFEALKEYCDRDGLMINIELKNSNTRYEGMEEAVLALVKEYGLERNIVYSSFLPESIQLVKKLNPEAQTGILNNSLEMCIEAAGWTNADALHPWLGGYDLPWEKRAEIPNMTIRAYGDAEPRFDVKGRFKKRDLSQLVELGITDFITNAPEEYL